MLRCSFHCPGFVFSGLGPDYRVLVRKSRKRAQTYYLTYRVSSST